MRIRNEVGGMLRGWRALGALGCLLLILLTGCAGGNAPNVGTTSGDTGTLAGNDPNAAPTPPPFPAFTVGAWVNDMSPKKGKTDRLYVLVRLHDSAMAGPSQPPPEGSIQVTAIIDSTPQQKSNDKAGYIFFDFTANAPPTVPSVITVTAVYQGRPYQTTTFYTVLPEIKGTPTPGAGTPTVTPTPHP